MKQLFADHLIQPIANVESFNQKILRLMETEKGRCQHTAERAWFPIVEIRSPSDPSWRRLCVAEGYCEACTTSVRILQIVPIDLQAEIAKHLTFAGVDYRFKWYRMRALKTGERFLPLPVEASPLLSSFVAFRKFFAIPLTWIDSVSPRGIKWDIGS